MNTTKTSIPQSTLNPLLSIQMSLRDEMWTEMLALSNQLAAMKAELRQTRDPQQNPLRKIHNTMQEHLESLQGILYNLDQYVQEVANTAVEKALKKAHAAIQNEGRRNTRVEVNVQSGDHETAVEYSNHRNSRGHEYQHQYQHRQSGSALVSSRTASPLHSQLEDAANYVRRREAGVGGHQSSMQSRLENAANYIRRREGGVRGRKVPAREIVHHATWKDI